MDGGFIPHGLSYWLTPSAWINWQSNGLLIVKFYRAYGDWQPCSVLINTPQKSINGIIIVECQKQNSSAYSIAVVGEEWGVSESDTCKLGLKDIFNLK